MNEQQLEAKAADLGISVEDLQRRVGYDDLVPHVPIELRQPAATRDADRAVSVLSELRDIAWRGSLLGDNAVLRMLLLEAEELAREFVRRANGRAVN